MPIGQALNAATGGGAITWIGLVVLAVALAALYFGRGKGARMAGGGAVVGLVIAVIGVAVSTLTPATGAVTAPIVPGATVNTLEATSPALVAGTSWNTVTSILTVDLEYNTTSSYFCTQSVFSATKGCGAGAGSTGGIQYVLLPLNLIRTDTINTTASFPMTISTIPVANSLGSSPSTYSIVGFSAATGTQPGQWKEYWGAGTTANQNPGVSAPQVSTNVQTDGLAVTSFSHTVNTLHITLAGANSTSAPAAFAHALQNYTVYPEVVTIGGSTPATITINFILIGYTS